MKVAGSKSGYAQLKPSKDFLMRLNALSFGGRLSKIGLVNTLLTDVRFQGDIANWLSGTKEKEAGDRQLRKSRSSVKITFSERFSEIWSFKGYFGYGKAWIHEVVVLDILDQI
jgi:hypothetical protein